MGAEEQKSLCADNCSVVRAKNEVITARTKMGEMASNLARLSLIADADGMLEVLAAEITLGDITADAAITLAGIAKRTCPLAHGEKIGLRRRVFPTGCGSPIVGQRSINDMTTYTTLVELRCKQAEEALKKLESE